MTTLQFIDFSEQKGTYFGISYALTPEDFHLYLINSAPFSLFSTLIEEPLDESVLLCEKD